jgi:hypothetical protein
MKTIPGIPLLSRNIYSLEDFTWRISVKTMTAFYKGSLASEAVFQEMEIPLLGANDVLIKIKVSYICGTDLLVAEGLLEETCYPLILAFIWMAVLPNTLKCLHHVSLKSIRI